MPKTIPVSAAKRISELHRCRQVILLAWDGELTHIVTYGKTPEDSAQAAKGGNLLRTKFCWPESNLQPPIVAGLMARIAELEDMVMNLMSQSEITPL